jgi:hypothetical protein
VPGRRGPRPFRREWRRLATLIDGELAAGPHALPWTGFDDAGRRVGTGATS